MTQQPGHPGPGPDDEYTEQNAEETPEGGAGQEDAQPTQPYPDSGFPGAQEPVPDPLAEPVSGTSAASAPEAGLPYDQQQPEVQQGWDAGQQSHYGAPSQEPSPGHGYDPAPGSYEAQQPGQPGYPQGYGQPGPESQGAYEQPHQGYYGQQVPPEQAAQSAGSAQPAYGYGHQQDPYAAQQAHYGPQYGGQPYGQPYEQQYQQHYGQQPQAGAPGHAPAGNSVEGKSFISALFDFTFQSFVTVKFAKFIYIILMAFLVLGWVIAVISGFVADPVVGLLALLLGWIPAAIYLILIRITLEFFIAMIRTSQSTAGVRVEIEELRGELRDRA
ncbi:DUF4282 domain-containing protein [Nesterenkonia sp. HG001]|uniref:DUF4282 domain-containing protein n=1 Tax=Nesterenkonia sp. HG001 TaxID=2983207 RepID=UPI002AC4F897|nr:DUF4282 domain-containing protein [Nesterenkonia sp. HG001]MDZ5079034.1 DUF4282 domain-containing protein [Nesterenkonia sp. HG001]